MVAEYYHTKEHIKEDLALYHSIFESQLAANIWNIDKRQLQLNVRSILTLDVIVGIQIRNDTLFTQNGEVFLKEQKSEKEYTLQQLF